MSSRSACLQRSVSSASHRSSRPATAAGPRLGSDTSAAPRPRSALSAAMNGTAGGGDYRLEDDYQDADESAPLHPEDLYSGRSVILSTPVRVHRCEASCRKAASPRQGKYYAVVMAIKAPLFIDIGQSLDLCLCEFPFHHSLLIQRTEFRIHSASVRHGRTTHTLIYLPSPVSCVFRC